MPKVSVYSVNFLEVSILFLIHIFIVILAIFIDYSKLFTKLFFLLTSSSFQVLIIIFLRYEQFHSHWEFLFSVLIRELYSVMKISLVSILRLKLKRNTLSMCFFKVGIINNISLLQYFLKLLKVEDFKEIIIIINLSLSYFLSILFLCQVILKTLSNKYTQNYIVFLLTPPCHSLLLCNISDI